MELIDPSNLKIEQLIFWKEKLTSEIKELTKIINDRIKDTLCPYCQSTIGEELLDYCPHCGGHIKWIWEE